MDSQPLTIAYAIGRLEGLAGSVRYELDDELRNELKQIANLLKDTPTE